jgi:predicted dehydrogenase
MKSPKDPTRRAFIKGAIAFTAPTLLGFPRIALGASSSPFAQERAQGKLGVVLAGLGGFSNGSIAPELASCQNVYFAGVVTADPLGKGRRYAAQYKFPETNIYTYDQIPHLADNNDVDVVHVVTPNGLHAAHAIAALQAGKHVMCEKPMEISSQRCQAMIDAAQKAGRYLGIDYRLHFEPHHMEMMRLANEKVYGAVTSLSTEFSWHRGNGKPWLSNKTLAGGGAMFDTGVYSIQAGCYISGATPIALTAFPSTTDPGYPPGIEETMKVAFEYPGGVTHEGRATYTAGREEFIVHAEHGTFSCTGKSFSQSVHGKPMPKQIVLPDGTKPTIPDTLQLAVLHDRFAEAIRTKQPFACPGEMGLRDIRILEAIYESVAQGSKRVTLALG